MSPPLWPRPAALFLACAVASCTPIPTPDSGPPSDGGATPASAPNDGGLDAGFDARDAAEGDRRPDGGPGGAASVMDAGAPDSGSSNAEDPLPEPTGAFTTHSAGGLSYRLYRPSSDDGNTPLPLVMMLHGCGQNAAGFAADTRMNAHAEARRFVVAYPEQPLSANFSRCWNWFSQGHQARAAGEPAALAAVVADVRARANIDDVRTFVAGLSAGGAMAAILAATYPDVFARAGVVAGLVYAAANDASESLRVMGSGVVNPAANGRAAHAAMGQAARVVPVMVFHGSADGVVAPVNGEQVVAQWAVTNDLAKDGLEDGDIDDQADETVPSQVLGGRSYTIRRYHDEIGAMVIESVRVDGMGHAWPGGWPGSPYTDPAAPDASAMLGRFFSGP